MNEIFYAIFGRIFFNKFFIGKIDFFEEGLPYLVEFDYYKILDKIKQGYNLLGFYHTHPNMNNLMSNIDIATMEAWTVSEGKRLLCIIEGDNGIATYDCYCVDWSSFTNLKNTFVNKKRDFKIKKIGKYIIGW